MLVVVVVVGEMRVQLRAKLVVFSQTRGWAAHDVGKGEWEERSSAYAGLFISGRELTKHPSLFSFLTRANTTQH